MSLILFNFMKNPGYFDALLSGNFAIVLHEPIFIVSLLGLCFYSFQLLKNFANAKQKYDSEIKSMRSNHLIANDGCALDHIVKIGCEQETKEEILLVEFLHHSKKAMRLNELDDIIEEFLKLNDEKSDFDVDKAARLAVRDGWAEWLSSGILSPKFYNRLN